MEDSFLKLNSKKIFENRVCNLPYNTIDVCKNFSLNHHMFK